MQAKFHYIVVFIIGAVCMLALLLFSNLANLPSPESDNQPTPTEITVDGTPDSIMDLNIIFETDPETEPIDAFHDISTYLEYQLAQVEAQRDSLPPPTRDELLELLGVPSTCLNNQSASLISEQQLANTSVDFEVYELSLSVCEDEMTLRGLYVPNADAPLIIAIHGTAGSPERILGLDNVDDYHHQFAKQLVEAGFTVFAPYIVTQPIDSEFINRDRNALDRRARVLGFSLVGIEIGQLMAIDNYFADTHSQFGVYGISLGGQLAYYLGASEPNMDVTIVSSWVEDRDEKLAGDNVLLYPLWMLYKSGQFNLLDDYLLVFDDVRLAGLIQPRPLYFDSGESDARSQAVPMVVDEIESQYYSGLEENIDYFIGQGGHEIFFPEANTFIQSVFND